MQYRYHFLYRTTNTITGKFYIGAHSTNDINDTYLGSGLVLNRSITKYGALNHIREIIMFVHDARELYDIEKLIVDEELLNNPMCMNLKLGGKGGWDYAHKIGHSAESRQKIGSKNAVHQIGSGNSQYGLRWAWVWKMGTTKRIPLDELQLYTDDGWVRGLKDPKTKVNRAKKTIRKRNYSILKCRRCGVSFAASQRDVRRNRMFCSLRCFHDQRMIRDL